MFFLGTTAVALTKVHVNPTKVSFSSLASASDENENHFAYLESKKKQKRHASKGHLLKGLFACCRVLKCKLAKEDSAVHTVT